MFCAGQEDFQTGSEPLWGHRHACSCLLGSAWLDLSFTVSRQATVVAQRGPLLGSMRGAWGSGVTPCLLMGQELGSWLEPPLRAHVGVLALWSSPRSLKFLSNSVTGL